MSATSLRGLLSACGAVPVPIDVERPAARLRTSGHLVDPSAQAARLAATAEGASRAKAERERAKAQAIVIGKYRIWKSDSLNWTIREGDDEDTEGYYPSLSWAIHALLHRRIGERAKKDVKSIDAAVKAAEKEILAALKRMGHEED